MPTFMPKITRRQYVPFVRKPKRTGRVKLLANEGYCLCDGFGEVVDKITNDVRICKLCKGVGKYKKSA